MKEPWHDRTLLQRLKTLEGDLKVVLVRELCGIVQDVDTEKRDNRHVGVWFGVCCCVQGIRKGYQWFGRLEPESRKIYAIVACLCAVSVVLCKRRQNRECASPKRKIESDERK